jgi:hypothetical protein
MRCSLSQVYLSDIACTCVRHNTEYYRHNFECLRHSFDIFMLNVKNFRHNFDAFIQNVEIFRHYFGTIKKDVVEILRHKI